MTDACEAFVFRTICASGEVLRYLNLDALNKCCLMVANAASASGFIVKCFALHLRGLVRGCRI